MYEYTSIYYTAPTQVKYYDPDFNSFLIGIGIGDKLITNEGDYVDIEYIISKAKENNIFWDDAIVELSWKNLK